MTAKQAEYVCRKCKFEGTIGIEQVYEHESNDKQQTDSQLNPYECAMLKDFELYNVHSQIAEREKWSILTTNKDYVEYGRKKTLPSKRVKYKWTEGIWQKGYRQIKG